MRSFDKIFEMAARHKGGPKKLELLLSRPLSPGKLRKIPDDRWLAEMTKCVFQAGFNWQIIESKWGGFEKTFKGFDVSRWALMTPDDLDALMKSEAIVKNAGKIHSVGENAKFLSDISREHGSAGAYFSTWRVETYCANLRTLQKKACRMGGRTGQTFLRRMGVSTLIFTPDVLKALAREGVIDKAPGAGDAWLSLQRALDRWVAESDRSLTEISQILAFSVG